MNVKRAESVVNISVINLKCLKMGVTDWVNLKIPPLSITVYLSLSINSFFFTH
jgi:hypothetical protein